MSGVTDLAFRNAAHGLGAALVVTEMVASEHLVTDRHHARRKAQRGDARPFVIQLAGCEARWMADGARYAEDLGADAIDTWVNPNEIAGIEVYTGPGVPAQFTTGMGGGGLGGQICGSLIIWTKPLARATRTSWKARVAKVLGLAAVVLGIRAVTD